VEAYITFGLLIQLIQELLFSSL